MISRIYYTEEQKFQSPLSLEIISIIRGSV